MDAEGGAAFTGAIAATGTKDQAEFVLVNVEFVLNPVPLPLRLVCAGIVTRGMMREQRKLAGVPRFDPGPGHRVAFLDDVETVTRRTNIGTSTTTDTSE